MGNRVKINTGQEFTSNDQMDHQRLRDKFLQEMILRRLFADNASACFFSDDCRVLSVGGMGIEIDVGLGFQWVSGEANADESKFQAIYVGTAEPITVDTADATNPRKDIVVIKAARLDAEVESRFIMGVDENITSQNVNTKSNDDFDFQYVAGTPNAVPVEPAVPSGYVKIATIDVAALAASVTQGNITDHRVVAHRGHIMSTGRHGYKHQQGSGDTTWTITHNLGSIDHIIQFYDDATGLELHPDTITRGANVDTVTWTESQDGVALLFRIN